MKIGLENKKTAIVAAVLVVFAAWYGIHQFGNSGSPPSTIGTPGVAQRSRVVPRSQPRTNTQVNTPSLDPRLKLDLLHASERIAYSGGGRNIFQDTREKLPEIKHPVITPIPPPIANNTPQGPPPIRLKFFGFANRPGEPKQVFLADGDDVFIARQGDVVDRQYKVVEIRSAEVVIQDILNNNTQRIPLTAG
jgi:hypothetical protein